MNVKDGTAHLRALDKDREVYLDGQLITRVADHPAFAAACRSAAALYDFQADPANVERMTFETETGRRANRGWQMPRSYAELVARREALTAWAELHGGFMGRSPDHLSSAIAGQAMGIEVFERHGARFGTALRDYYAYARDNDLYLCYVIVNPQGDRSKAWGEQSSEDMTMRVVDEDSGRRDRARGEDARHRLGHGGGGPGRESAAAEAGRRALRHLLRAAARCPRHQGALAQELRGERRQRLGQPALPPLRRERLHCLF